MSLAKVLYRDLLVAARAFDRRAALRALVSSNLLQRPLLPGSTERVRHLEALNRILLAFLERRSFYLPSADREPLAALVRAKFRTPEAARSSGEGVDLAFAALRALTDTLARARELGVLNDSVEVEAGDEELGDGVNALPVRNVQLAESVATGTFLLAHPLLGGTFRRAVVVLTEHGQKGSRGFIVNHVTNKLLSSTFRVHSRIIHAFGTSKVHRGGPVPTDHAEILHSRPDFGGERVVTSNLPTHNEDKLFVGLDLQTAAQAVEEKTALQSDVVFLNGVSTWTVGQLDNELQRGTWVAVKAPISLALNAKKELWQELMGALGGEYEEFSKMPVIYDDDFDEEDDLEV